MEQGSRIGVRYALDAGDELVSVNEEFLEYARANGAPELTRESLLGCPVWSFIAGEETRRLYELIFARVRSHGRPVTIPFRCDSPDRYRFMELQISPWLEGGIVMEGVLIREQHRTYLPLMDAALPRADYRYPMCSLCKRIFVFGEWLEPEEAVARLDMFDSSHPPGLDHGLCSDCDRPYPNLPLPS